MPQDRGGDSILSQGATPLLRAARAGDTPMVELLLEHGALVDLPSNQGVTPLMAAAGVEYGLRVTRGRNRTDEGVLSTMRALLDAGADIEARTLIEPRGESAAHLLVIEQRLSDFSYDYRGRQVPSVRAKPHRTALHGAAMKGFTPIVKFLAENGADLYAKDANGSTALDLAEGNYNEPFLRQAAEPHAETAAVLQGAHGGAAAGGAALEHGRRPLSSRLRPYAAAWRIALFRAGSRQLPPTTTLPPLMTTSTSSSAPLVGERIAAQDHDVGELADLERAQVLAAADGDRGVLAS